MTDEWIERKDRKKTDMQTSIKCSVKCTVKQQYWFQNPLCHWKSPFHPSHPLYLPFTLCRPLYVSSVPLVCSKHPLYMSPVLPSLSLSPPVHPLSPQVFSCHLLYMSLSPPSPRHPLHGRWLLGEVLCSLYIVILAVTNHEIKSSINIFVHEKLWNV